MLPLANGLGAEAGRSVYYGLRPEYFSLAGKRAKGAIQADVAVVEPTGAETLVICRIEGQDIQVLFTERNELQPELTISLVPKRDHNCCSTTVTVSAFDDGAKRR